MADETNERRSGNERRSPDPDLFHDDEMRRLRARMHNLADMVQGHALFLEAHRIEIERNISDIRELRAMTVTHAQLASEKLLLDTRLRMIEDGQKKMNDNMTWLVRLVFGVLIVAILGLIVQTKAKAAGHDDRPRPSLHVPGGVQPPTSADGHAPGQGGAPRDWTAGKPDAASQTDRRAGA